MRLIIIDNERAGYRRYPGDAGTEKKEKNERMHTDQSG